MKKYKNKLSGDTVTQTSGHFCTFDQFTSSIPLRCVENFNDWIEIKDEYPKIISFRRIKVDIIDALVGELFILNKGYYHPKSMVNGFSLEQMLLKGCCVESKHFEIYQVATSENVIFTVGDKVSVTDNPYWNGSCYVTSKSGIWGSDYNKTSIREFKIISEGILCIYNTHYTYYGQLIQHVNKVQQPLFTTEDGKEIFKGDEYVYVDGASWLSHPGKANKHFGPHLSFSTFEAANKYIEQNKPKFSVKDVEDVLNECTTHCSWITSEFKVVNINKFKQKLGI